MVTYEGGREEEKEITVWQRKECRVRVLVDNNHVRCLPYCVY